MVVLAAPAPATAAIDVVAQETGPEKFGSEILIVIRRLQELALSLWLEENPLLPRVLAFPSGFAVVVRQILPYPERGGSLRRLVLTSARLARMAACPP